MFSERVESIISQAVRLGLVSSDSSERVSTVIRRRYQVHSKIVPVPNLFSELCLPPRRGGRRQKHAKGYRGKQSKFPPLGSACLLVVGFDGVSSGNDLDGRVQAECPSTVNLFNPDDLNLRARRAAVDNLPTRRRPRPGPRGLSVDIADRSGRSCFHGARRYRQSTSCRSRWRLLPTSRARRHPHLSYDSKRVHRRRGDALTEIGPLTPAAKDDNVPDLHNRHDNRSKPGVQRERCPVGPGFENNN